MELYIQRRMGWVCMHCDTKPRNYRKLTDEGWVNFSICPECGHIFNFFIEDVSALTAAQKRYALVRMCARLFIPNIRESQGM